MFVECKITNMKSARYTYVNATHFWLGGFGVSSNWVLPSSKFFREKSNCSCHLSPRSRHSWCDCGTTHVQRFQAKLRSSMFHFFAAAFFLSLSSSFFKPWSLKKPIGARRCMITYQYSIYGTRPQLLRLQPPVHCRIEKPHAAAAGRYQRRAVAVSRFPLIHRLSTTFRIKSLTTNSIPIQIEHITIVVVIVWLIAFVAIIGSKTDSRILNFQFSQYTDEKLGTASASTAEQDWCRWCHVKYPPGRHVTLCLLLLHHYLLHITTA